MLSPRYGRPEHTDQGSRFTGAAFISVLADNGIVDLGKNLARSTIRRLDFRASKMFLRVSKK
jgi:hypothetical protein